MKIAVFGTGIVGQVIADRLIGLGHEVTLGTRNVSNTLARKEKDNYGSPPVSEWYEQRKSKLKMEDYAKAASHAEIIFNCTSGQGAVEALTMAGKDNLKGKLLIDIANPLDFSHGMPPTLSPVNTDSLGELIQRTFPEARVVKTLNTMNCYLMVQPALLQEDHHVFMSGNDESAKAQTKNILASFGWKENQIIDLGDITTARGTEQLLPIWIRLWGKLKNPMFNFKIVIGKAPSA